MSASGRSRRRPSATEYVRPTARPTRHRARRERRVEAPRARRAPLALPAGFVLLLGALAAWGRLPWPIVIAYVILSLLAFAVYAVDKTAAMRGAWRTPERTLHLLALVGGWPGAWAAQRLLHHKSRKPGFRVRFWGTVVVNVLAVAWLLTPGGRAVLSALG
ncbi:DUF1294 domain-containing protein [Ectothiorhodospiraceae bacterium 2226]|nr:DUF1294 domain-containing protein [Ectothiorhodospiraceae bacterium 2226]